MSLSSDLSLIVIIIIIITTFTMHHSIPDSKLTFSINPSHHSLPHIFGRISRIFMTISELISSFLVLFFSLHFFLFDSCDRLSWFNQFLNCTLNPCTFLSFPFFQWRREGGRRGHPPRAALCRGGICRGKNRVFWNFTPKLSVLFTVHTNAIVVTIRITIGDLIAGVGAATKTFSPGDKHSLSHWSPLPLKCRSTSSARQ